MPQAPEHTGSSKKKSKKSKSKKSHQRTDSTATNMSGDAAAAPSSSALPPTVRVRLYELFVQIEREFETLYTENLALQETIERMSSSSSQSKRQTTTTTTTEPQTPTSAPNANLADGTYQSSSKLPSSSGGGGGGGHHHSKGLYKLRSHTNKLRAQTNRIMSNLKAGPALNCTPVRRYTGHKDGIWEVSVSRMGLPIIGTASADHTAMIWGMHSGQALMQYTGHSGSVNSIRFHPTKELVMTASGDSTVHIWQCAVHLYNESSSGRVASSEDELDTPAAQRPQQLQNKRSADFVGFSSGLDEDSQFSVLRTPLRSLDGHTECVIAADWLPGGEQAVTAGEI